MQPATNANRGGGTGGRARLSISRKWLLAALASACVLATAAEDARAHPHVWVRMKSELVFAADGAVTGIRHAWTFDDMYSAFAVQGLSHKKEGEFSRAELASLAEVNVTSLKEYGYFTRARLNGKNLPISDPVDYWLGYGDSVLTLHFTLPFKASAAVKHLSFEIYDPTWFVDFSFPDTEPVALPGAPQGCRLDVQRPTGLTAAQGQQLSEAFFNSLAATSNFGAQFANKVLVQCP